MLALFDHYSCSLYPELFINMSARQQMTANKINTLMYVQCYKERLKKVVKIALPHHKYSACNAKLRHSSESSGQDKSPDNNFWKHIYIEQQHAKEK